MRQSAYKTDQHKGMPQGGTAGWEHNEKMRPDIDAIRNSFAGWARGMNVWRVPEATGVISIRALAPNL